MNITQTREQIRALSALQEHSELENILLSSCSAERASGNPKFNEPFSVRPGLTNVSYFERGDKFVVNVHFQYSAWDSSEPSQRIFIILCTFEASYRLRDGYRPNDDEQSSFSKGTAVFNCWPYAREFFSDMTNRLGHQAPVLPLLRITPKKADAAVGQLATAPTEQAPLKEVRAQIEGSV